MEKILVTGQQRTGSNLLCYALSFFENHRNINEFFNFDANSDIFNLFLSEEERKSLFDWASRPDKRADESILRWNINQDPFGALDFVCSFDDQNKVVKILECHFFTNPKLYELIDSFDKFIILERSNKLEQYVSLRIAEENRGWWGINTDHFKIELDVEKYWHYCNASDIFYEDLKLKLKDKNYITINYEEDLINGITDSLLTKLQEFLGGPEIVLQDRDKVKKQNTTNVIDKITNWDEVRKYI